MRRRHLINIAVAVVVGASASVTTASPLQLSKRCAAGRTVAVNGDVRVFISPGKPGRAGDYYVCDRSVGRSLLLSRQYVGVAVYKLNRVRFAGHLIAYQRSVIEADSPEADPALTVVVRDIRTGRQKRSLPAAEARTQATVEYDPRDEIRDLVLTSRGDLAWIIQNSRALPSPASSTRSTEVYVAPRDARTSTLVDQGDGIVHTSLTSARCVVRWTKDGTVHQARLCP